MANTIILKRSATPGKVPTTSQIALGEIAINTHDGLIYIKKDDGTPSVVQIGGVTSVNGETGAVTISSDDVSDSGQTNKWFTNALARGAISAGTGISYNSSTGVISTSQSITSSSSPTFAGLTLTGDLGMTGSIIPSADITYDLGSPTKQWKDIYVGPGSLYVNGSKVLQDDTGTITFSADLDQNIRIKTTGNGILQLGSATTTLQVDSTLQMTAGKRITSSDGVKVQFGDDVEMNGNKIIGLGAPSVNTDAATKKYVDDAVGAVSTSSIASGNSNISVVDTGTGTVTVTVDGSTALTVDATGVTVAGNFTVSGTQTTVNANTIALADNIITLNSDATGTPTQNAGIEVERGDEANVQIRWNEGLQRWGFTNDGATYYGIATSTDTLAEGSTNKYFSNTLARGAINASSSTGVSYNSTTGAISLGSIPNTSLTNSSTTIGTTAIALGASSTTLAGLTSVTSTSFVGALTGNASTVTNGVYTTDTGTVTNTMLAGSIANAKLANSAVTVTAGTGLSGGGSVSLGGTITLTNTITQYTDALARGAVSVSGDLSYNSTTGVISFTQNKAWSALTGTPTTISGYGITNAYTKTEVDSAISTAVAGKDNTDEITEGTTNLYFTNGRARGAVSFTAGSGAYNSTTGVFSIPTNTNQLTNGAGFITGYTETDTLATVTARGATTSAALSTGALTVSGAITATGEVTAYYSDLRLKTNIVPIADALAKVEAINGVTFDPNETALGLGIDNRHQMGVIAQEVEAVAPELVTDSAFAGYKTVRYDKLTALLIEAVKELSAKVTTLEAQLGNSKPTL